MKCTNKCRRLLCLLGIAAIFISGCGTQQIEIQKSYDVYRFPNTFANQTASADTAYFAEDLCVINTVNFNMENAYAEIAKAAGVFNISTNEVLYSQNIFTPLYPASTTKILTAYIILRDCNLSDVVTISESAATQDTDSSVCGLKAGDNIAVLDLLYGLLLSSGNDAAEALAEYHSGSLAAFAEEMNVTAHALGATNSQFQNPSGLPNKEHYTTVYDMYLIFQEALKQEKFVEIIHTESKNAVYTNVKGETVKKTFSTSNRYLNQNEKIAEGFTVIGGKTGTTYDAGYCLVLYSKNPDGEDIISIVLKAENRYNLYFLMNQILANFAK